MSRTFCPECKLQNVSIPEIKEELEKYENISGFLWLLENELRKTICSLKGSTDKDLNGRTFEHRTDVLPVMQAIQGRSLKSSSVNYLLCRHHHYEFSRRILETMTANEALVKGISNLKKGLNNFDESPDISNLYAIAHTYADQIDVKMTELIQAANKLKRKAYAVALLKKENSYDLISLDTFNKMRQLGEGYQSGKKWVIFEDLFLAMENADGYHSVRASNLTTKELNLIDSINNSIDLGLDVIRWINEDEKTCYGFQLNNKISGPLGCHSIDQAFKTRDLYTKMGITFLKFFIVTTGEITNQAKEEAERLGFEIIIGKDLELRVARIQWSRIKSYDSLPGIYDGIQSESEAQHKEVLARKFLYKAVEGDTSQLTPKEFVARLPLNLRLAHPIPENTSWRRYERASENPGIQFVAKKLPDDLQNYDGEPFNQYGGLVGDWLEDAIFLECLYGVYFVSKSIGVSNDFYIDFGDAKEAYLSIRRSLQ